VGKGEVELASSIGKDDEAKKRPKNLFLKRRGPKLGGGGKHIAQALGCPRQRLLG